MENNKEVKREVAKFMVKKLWCRGLITDSEFGEINSKIEVEFN